MYRNTLLEFRLFIVLIHLSRLAPTLQTIYNKLKTTEPSIVPVPEDIDMIWKGVVNVREHLRSKKQEFQISKGISLSDIFFLFLFPQQSHQLHG